MAKIDPAYNGGVIAVIIGLLLFTSCSISSCLGFSTGCKDEKYLAFVTVGLVIFFAWLIKADRQDHKSKKK